MKSLLPLVILILLPILLFGLSPSLGPDYSKEYEDSLVVLEGRLSERAVNQLRVTFQEYNRDKGHYVGRKSEKDYFLIDLIVDGKIKYNGSEVPPADTVRRKLDGTYISTTYHYRIYVQEGVQLNKQNQNEKRTWFLYQSPIVGSRYLFGLHSTSIENASSVIAGYMKDGDYPKTTRPIQSR